MQKESRLSEVVDRKREKEKASKKRRLRLKNNTQKCGVDLNAVRLLMIWNHVRTDPSCACLFHNLCQRHGTMAIGHWLVSKYWK